MRLTDVAWLAGLLEGEACFVRGASNGSVGVQLAMTDRDVVERAARLLGRPVRARSVPARHPHYKPQWRVLVVGKVAVGWLMTIYPFMGERRQARLRELIAAWKQAPGRGAPGRPRLNRRLVAA